MPLFTVSFYFIPEHTGGMEGGVPSHPVFWERLPRWVDEFSWGEFFFFFLIVLEKIVASPLCSWCTDKLHKPSLSGKNHESSVRTSIYVVHGTLYRRA